ncbi:cell wall-active antibiotics response protein LiaF [Alkaliphilus peptidifermentans]|uniref:Cell wall-active antibiotics response 4TMS YvqF n=1 Tax=Alkaliphilus peptidifermentans DSM 18978 TaxID=1120976 RepID=A0A1G5JLH3_9FIRM|nr:cell wall-active antibiotics response protein LiaF [Alkaliphilus peptidifermentans]SCY89252.1 Cell wall-active antibiotics response 4TMS YvqF [Alkaliphilus peptidifermentans DSM 18978]
MKRTTIGLLLILGGALYLLGNMGFLLFHPGDILKAYWPIILVLWGFNDIYKSIRFNGNKMRLQGLFFPVFLILIGFVLIGNHLDWFGGSINVWQVIWPLAFIFIGLSFFTSPRITYMGGSKSDVHIHFKDIKNRYINIGSFELGNEPWGLEDTSVHVGLGEATINLTKALIKEGETNLNIAGHIGSITVLVPTDLAIDVIADLRLGNIELFDIDHTGTPGTITYRTPNYDAAYKKVSLRLTLKIGEIQLKRVD